MIPAFEDPSVTAYLGDCVEIIAQLPDVSVDAVVTDPPYGLEFMGKGWDSFRLDDPGTARHRGTHVGGHGEVKQNNSTNPAAGVVAYGGGKRPSTSRCTGCGRRDQFRKDHECADGARWVPVVLDPHAAPPTMLAFGEWCRRWAEQAYRVLKPGGHLLAFGGTRTWHRLAAGVEDAGFEVRDSLAWVYGSGFPKSMDVSKAIDKAAGVEREREAPQHRARPSDSIHASGFGADGWAPQSRVAVSEEAAHWSGWGTALKPGFEPIVLARKPLAGTVASNVLTHGTGALNVDACRIPHASAADLAESQGKNRHADFGTPPGGNTVYGDFSMVESTNYDGAAGRWPANVVLDEDQAAVLDRLARLSSRFFYVAKAGTAERPVLDGAGHPTVKPLTLMRWLVRLITPPGGTVLEPFLGSGTTAEACVIEGMRCIGIERDPKYMALVQRRLAKPIQTDMFGGVA